MKKFPPQRLEEIPNIGKSIAVDLRGLGIMNPEQLSKQDPLKVYLQLGKTMGARHDPCVLYTLLAAGKFLQTGESTAWWKLTEEGKSMLAKVNKTG